MASVDKGDKDFEAGFEEKEPEPATKKMTADEITAMQQDKLRAIQHSINDENDIGSHSLDRQVDKESGIKAPAPTKDDPDYDLDAYIAKYGKPDQSKGQHLTDEFKKPNHRTFSDESVYSNEFEKGGSWLKMGDEKSETYVFKPSEHNLKVTPQPEMAKYFREHEFKGTFVEFPDGTTVEGTMSKEKQ